jgi:hypothetical protein
MHYVPHILKDYVDAYAHPCISLLKMSFRDTSIFISFEQVVLLLLYFYAFLHLLVFKII